MRILYPCLALTLAMAFTPACHAKTPPAAPPAPPHAAPTPAPLGNPPPAPPATRPASPPAAPAPPSAEDLFNRESLSQLNSEHPLGDAFFDYDSATLRDDARRALQADATWLQRWRQTAIRVDGHCDERGTPEYNLALGERRAKAVEAYLVSLGVEPKRIAVNSLGKESPFCTTAADDACWSQNRRGHFLIVAK